MEEDHDHLEPNDWEHIPAPWRHRPNPSSAGTTCAAAAAVPEESEGSATIELNTHHLLHDYCSISVFPPIDHEGLPVSFQSTPPTELLEIPSVPPLEAATVRNNSGSGTGMSKLRTWVRTLFNSIMVRGGRFLYSLLLCLAGALVQRWSRRVLLRPRGGNQDQLALLIKEKDERINELLLRVSQVNQVLHTRRKVPVFRINTT